MSQPPHDLPGIIRERDLELPPVVLSAIRRRVAEMRRRRALGRIHVLIDVGQGTAITARIEVTTGPDAGQWERVRVP